VIFLDHFGPIEFKAGEAKGASAHPHAGIETLTLLLEGSSVHKDSMGNTSSMRPGEVQWMRAGAGVIHDESPDPELLKTGGRNHGVQLWFNMPKGKSMMRLSINTTVRMSFQSLSVRMERARRVSLLGKLLA